MGINLVKRSISAALNFIGTVEMGIAILCLSVMLGCISTQVVTRYVFGKPLTWPEELATIAFVWMVLFGTSYVYKMGGHVSISVLTDRLSPKIFLIMNLIIDMCIAVFLYIVAEGAERLVSLQMRNLTVALRLPWAVYTLPLLIIAISMLVTTIWRIAVSIGEFPSNWKHTINQTRSAS